MLKKPYSSVGPPSFAEGTRSERGEEKEAKKEQINYR